MSLNSCTVCGVNLPKNAGKRCLEDCSDTLANVSITIITDQPKHRCIRQGDIFRMKEEDEWFYLCVRVNPPIKKGDWIYSGGWAIQAREDMKETIDCRAIFKISGKNFYLISESKSDFSSEALVECSEVGEIVKSSKRMNECWLHYNPFGLRNFILPEDDGWTEVRRY